MNNQEDHRLPPPNPMMVKFAIGIFVFLTGYLIVAYALRPEYQATIIPDPWQHIRFSSVYVRPSAEQHLIEVIIDTTGRTPSRWQPADSTVTSDDLMTLLIGGSASIKEPR